MGKYLCLVIYLIVICDTAFSQTKLSFDKYGRLNEQSIGNYKTLFIYDQLGNRLTLNQTNSSESQPVDIIASQNGQTPNSIPKGSQLNLSLGVENKSESTASNTFSEVYWSRENTINDNSLSLKTDFQYSIDANQTIQRELKIILPDTLSDGQGYLILKVDSKDLIEETNEENNLVVIPITIDNSLIPKRTIEANFQASLQYICPGSTVFFDDLSDGNPTSWNWEFEGGLPATSTEQTPHVIYEQAGIYEVKLTAKDGDIEGIKEQVGYIMVEGENSNNTTTVSIESEGSLAICDQGTVTLKAPDGFTGYFWSNGESASQVEVSEPGEYLLSVKKCNGDIIESSPVVVTQESFTVDVASITQATCNTGGEVSLDISGIESYEVEWSNGERRTTITNLESGFYEATVKSGSGCEKIIGVSIRQSELPTFEVEKIDTSCGEKNGSLNLVVDNPELYDIEWSDGSNAQSISDLSSGNYAVTIIDKTTGCSTSQSVFIEASERLSLEFEIDIVSTTCGEDNGSANIDFLGIEDFEIAWNGTAGTKNISDLPSGTHELLLTHETTGCTLLRSFDIASSENVFPEFEIQVVSTTCGEGNGSASIDFQNLEEFDITWDDTNGTSSIADLSAGSHELLLTHVTSGCTLQRSFNIEASENVFPEFEIQVVNTTCGANNGTAEIELENFESFDITWNGKSGTSSIVELVPGSHNLMLTHKNSGCTLEKTFEVLSSEDPIPDFEVNEEHTKCGKQNGTASLNLTNVEDFEIVWNGQTMGPNIEGLVVGSHTVEVRHKETGCFLVKEFEINGSQDDSPAYNLEIESTTCGEDNGKAVFNLESGNHEILLANNVVGTTLENLAPDTYIVTLINKDSGCSKNVEFTIEESDAIEDFELGEPVIVGIRQDIYELPDPGLGGTWGFQGNNQGVLRFSADSGKWSLLLTQSGLGVYELVYTVRTTDCLKQDILMITIDATTDIVDEVYEKTSIRLFPNPSDTEIFIKKENIGTELLRSLELITELGTSLVSKTYPTPIFEDVWKVSTYPSGLYFVVVTTDRGVYKLKVLIRH